MALVQTNPMQTMTMILKWLYHEAALSQNVYPGSRLRQVINGEGILAPVSEADLSHKIALAINT